MENEISSSKKKLSLKFCEKYMNTICIPLHQMTLIPRYWNLYLNYYIVDCCSEVTYNYCKT